MAIYGLHWKWQSVTPGQRHPSDPIENKIGLINYVIDLNNLAEFGFGKKYIRLLNHKWQTAHVYNQSTSYTITFKLCFISRFAWFF